MGSMKLRALGWVALLTVLFYSDKASAANIYAELLGGQPTLLTASDAQNAAEIGQYEYIYDVYMDNDQAVGGFQFGLDGVSITGASGGSATDAGFTLSTSGTTVLGFSFSGGSIPSGSGNLVTVSFDGFVDTICLAGVVMSDTSGVALDFSLSDCYPSGGCTDPTACNYDADAQEDDGSCIYCDDINTPKVPTANEI